MAGIGAPHAGGSIDDLAAVDGKIMHVLGAGEQPWRLLEGPVGGKRHPVRGEVVRDVDGGGIGALVEHGGLLLAGVWRYCAGYQLHRGTGTPVAAIFAFNQEVLRAVQAAQLAHKSAAAIQNTSPLESSVSSHNNGNCGKATSTTSRPRPISHNRPPCGVKCCPASSKMRLTISSPSAPPSKAILGSQRHW